MQHTKPGVSEAMLQAVMEFGVRKRGAAGLAYVPVVASGKRALIIHYVINNQIIGYVRYNSFIILIQYLEKMT